MNTEQNNKVAIVTGGGSGIGLAITTKFVQSNILTIIVGRDEKKLAAAKEKLGELCVPISCDLNDLTAIPKLVNGIISEYGRIDILVNNAGINLKKEFTEVSDEEFKKILLTNVTAVFVLSREVVKCMLEKGSGSIINISSMACPVAVAAYIRYPCHSGKHVIFHRALDYLSNSGTRAFGICVGLQAFFKKRSFINKIGCLSQVFLRDLEFHH